MVILFSCLHHHVNEVNERRVHRWKIFYNLLLMFFFLFVVRIMLLFYADENKHRNKNEYTVSCIIDRNKLCGKAYLYATLVAVCAFNKGSSANRQFFFLSFPSCIMFLSNILFLCLFSFYKRQKEKLFLEFSLLFVLCQ